jgi:DNA-binding GntR family transcriptional regulator
VGQLRGSLALTRMMMNSVELYRTLEAEVGLETGWRDVGSLRLASSPERLELTEARPADVRALGVRREAPLLLVERVRYAADGTPVEFARDRFRPDRTRVVLESTEVAE